MVIPILFVRDMGEAVAFHTGILDFTINFGWPDENPIYVGLMRGADELHLSLAPPGKPSGHCSAMLLTNDVDALAALYRARGLAPSAREDAPAHAAPIDQTWGTREFYIDDPSGNTLILQQR